MYTSEDAKIKQLVQKEIALDKQKAQYGVNRTPVHTHNGLDSPKIDFGAGLVNRQVIVTSHIPGTTAASNANYGHFYTNPFNFDALNNAINSTSGGMIILTIVAYWGRAGNDASPVSLGLFVLNPGDASVSGGTNPVTAFDLKQTANQPAYATLLTGQIPRILYPGQRLALQTSGVLTNVADVLVTVLMQY